MRLRASLAGAVTAALAVAVPAHASTYTVTGTADGTGTCNGTTVCTTLRAAVTEANRNTGTDSISLTAGTYTLSAQLQIADTVIIQGASALNTIISEDGKSGRVFNVVAEHNLALTHLTIQNGAATSASDPAGGNILVGAGDVLLLDHSRVTGGKAYRGGGIALGSNASAQITKSTIDNNTASSLPGVGYGDGGGIVSVGVQGGAGNTLTLTDSTVFHNTAPISAGIAVSGNPSNKTTITRSTIAGNSAGSTGGAGVWTSDGSSVTFAGSIISGNTGDGVASNCSAKFLTSGGNIDSGGTCGFGASDKPNTDPQLSTILSQGTDTPLLTIPGTSPAVDLVAIGTAACTGTGLLDQRDLARPQGLGCDAGAYEVDQAPVTSIDSAPGANIDVSTATFAFSSSEPGVTFQCKLDAGAAAPCTSPQTYSGLADGSHTFTVRATDATGNVEKTPPSATFTVDTKAPDVTITAGPNGPTNNNSPSFSYSSTDPTATFTCALDGVAQRPACPSPKAYTGLADGAHTFAVTAHDAAGNMTTATSSFTVDTVAPTAPTITTPASNVSQATTTVSLGGGAEPNSTVKVLESSTVRATTTANGQGLWSTSFTAADGVHNYTATATDAAGNTSAVSNVRTITVDTTAPAVTINSGPSGPTNSTSASFGFTAESGATTACQMDGGGFSACTSPAAYTSLGQGGHTFTVRATDAAGNSATASRSFTVDTTAPAPPAITTPAADALQNSSTVTVGGTAESGASVQLFDGAVSKGTATATGGTWTLTLSGVADGTHPYTAKATDAAGNVSGASATRTITVDTVAPNTTITGGPSGSTNNPSPSFSFTSSEAGSTFACALTGPGQTGTPVACTSPKAYSGLGDGAYTLSVRATDPAGNPDATPATQAFTVDTSVPGVAITSGPSGPTNTASPSFAFTADAGTTTTCRLDSGAFTACSSPAGYSNLAQGAHTFTVKASDGAGNSGTDSRSFTVDTIAPAAPAITSPADDSLQAISTVTLSGTAEGGATVTVSEGATQRGSTTATAGGAWSVTLNGVADGTHPYTAKAKDAAGNVSGASAARTITVDTVAPAVNVTSGPTGTTNNASPSFGFTAEAGAATTCQMDAGAFATCTSPAAYGGLGDGPHTFTVRATDPAGNSATASREFTVDTTPPPAAVTAGPDGTTTDSSPSFTFGSSDSATTFACKLDGPGAAQGSYGPCTSPKSFSGLAPGDYTFSVRATDPAGNSTETKRSFTVAQVAQATPTPTPTPGPVGPAQNPVPVYQKTVVIQPAGGKTLVQLPGTTTFVPVDVTRGIPLGSIVDTRHSRIRLFAIPKPGKPAESALFYDGLFKVTQLAGGVTQMVLVEQLAKCPTGKAASIAKKKPKTRKLWGDGSGAFSTKGQYSAATVRGTKWLVQDSCGKTLTRVAKGVVSVQDLVKRKTVLVRAPHSYTALKKKR